MSFGSNFLFTKEQKQCFCITSTLSDKFSFLNDFCPIPFHHHQESIPNRLRKTMLNRALFSVTLQSPIAHTETHIKPPHGLRGSDLFFPPLVYHCINLRILDGFPPIISSAPILFDKVITITVLPAR